MCVSYLCDTVDGVCNIVNNFFNTKFRLHTLSPLILTSVGLKSWFFVGSHSGILMGSYSVLLFLCLILLNLSLFWWTCGLLCIFLSLLISFYFFYNLKAHSLMIVGYKWQCLSRGYQMTEYNRVSIPCISCWLSCYLMYLTWR